MVTLDEYTEWKSKGSIQSSLEIRKVEFNESDLKDVKILKKETVWETKQKKKNKNSATINTAKIQPPKLEEEKPRDISHVQNSAIPVIKQRPKLYYLHEKEKEILTLCRERKFSQLTELLKTGMSENNLLNF